MECGRCCGVMVRGHCYDLRDENGSLNFSAWRCAGCGHVVEEILTTPHVGSKESRRIRYAVRPAMSATS